MDKVYAFQYCDCIHESAFYTVSLHSTEKGAQIAMEFHKAEELKEFNEMYERLEQEELGIEFGQMEAWRVLEFEVQE